MKKIFIVTGANGHLGLTIVKDLLARGESVRGLILDGTDESVFSGLGVELFYGNVLNKESLIPIFSGSGEKYVIHTAGIVTISSRYDEKVYKVNVLGTKNIINMCREFSVKRLVYVSSVHAIPEKEGIISEADFFDPTLVKGLYAKTKAEATQAVLDAAKSGEIDAVVVHPSGIIGVNDFLGGNITAMFKDYICGKLKLCVKGGYDFVDVLDVSSGIISAAEKGRTGECYILSNKYFTIKEIMDRIGEICGRKKAKVLPMWFVKMFTPALECHYRIKKQAPVVTAYSLYTITTNANFSHDKAARELDYSPRDIDETIRSMIDFLAETKKVTLKDKKPRQARIKKKCESRI